MEELETNDQQLPNGSDTDLDVTDIMVLDSDVEVKFLVKEDARAGQQSSSSSC